MRSCSRVVAMVIAVGAIAGCASFGDRADHAASSLGFQKLQLAGADFGHVAYFKPGSAGRELHVYIEHDGVPWIAPGKPADDPTPRRLVMLNLMARDPAPALYLGRPCYFGVARTPPCEPVWWTHRRFSPEVIFSMKAALSEFLRLHSTYRSVRFLGYSGGGVIATLMAADFPTTRGLVTVAAPLDLDGWTTMHGYAPLAGSIDPLRQPPLPDNIDQVHWVGSADKIVPEYLIARFVAHQVRAQLQKVPGVDHSCCWDAVWAEIVRRE